jgi:hypothetical protein
MLWLAPLFIVVFAYGSIATTRPSLFVHEPERGISLYKEPAVLMSESPLPPSYGNSSTGATEGTSVVIGLIGRDVGNELPYVLRNIERLQKAAQFKRTVVLLVENDSVDDTVSVFKE